MARRGTFQDPLRLAAAVLEPAGSAAIASTSAASRKGARTSRPQAMLARSTLVRMSSGR